MCASLKAVIYTGIVLLENIQIVSQMQGTFLTQIPITWTNTDSRGEMKPLSTGTILFSIFL